jgi:hypothetical protein
MTIIDPRFVDIDFETEARKRGIEHLGDNTPLAQRMGDAPQGLFGRYEENFAVGTDAERKASIERLDVDGGIERMVRWILNQGREGSCVGNAWTQGHMTKFALQFGEANAVHLSAISGYKQIGRSPGSGANIADALSKGREVGLLPLDTPENRQRFGAAVMPATGFYSPWPNGRETVQRQFRLDKILICRSVAEVEQAGIDGHPVIVGRSGHSIMYCRPSMKSGRGVIYCNSWGGGANGWGFGAGGHESGFGFDSARMVQSAAQYAWAVVSVVCPDYLIAA